MPNNHLIIENMKQLGLSEYEAKAYLSLLENYPVNGYSLSKKSGIPRSRIYEILESLKTKQIAFEEPGEKSKIYYPIDPKLLVNRLKQDFNNILDQVDSYTQRVYDKTVTDNKLVVIKGRSPIIEFLTTLILNSKKRIAISMWEEEVLALCPALDDAKSRGVSLRGIYFGKNNPYDEIITHRRLDRYFLEKNERYMTIIIDDIHVVSGIVSRGENSQVTWTKDPGFVAISEDYIAHDLMVNLYATKLSTSEQKSYEDYLDKIREDYFDL